MPELYSTGFFESKSTSELIGIYNQLDPKNAFEPGTYVPKPTIVAMILRNLVKTQPDHRPDGMRVTATGRVRPPKKRPEKFSEETKAAIRAKRERNGHGRRILDLPARDKREIKRPRVKTKAYKLLLALRRGATWAQLKKKFKWSDSNLNEFIMRLHHKGGYGFREEKIEGERVIFAIDPANVRIQRTYVKRMNIDVSSNGSTAPDNTGPSDPGSLPGG